MSNPLPASVEETLKTRAARWLAQEFHPTGHHHAAFVEVTTTHRLIVDLQSALLASETQHQWQPIETAPKDGTDVLLWCAGAMEPSYALIASWVDFKGEAPDGWCDASTGRYNDGCPPTHWMPLPSPPETP